MTICDRLIKAGVYKDRHHVDRAIYRGDLRVGTFRNGKPTIYQVITNIEKEGHPGQTVFMKDGKRIGDIPTPEKITLWTRIRDFIFNVSEPEDEVWLDGS